MIFISTNVIKISRSKECSMMVLFHAQAYFKKAFNSKSIVGNDR